MNAILKMLNISIVSSVISTYHSISQYLLILLHIFIVSSEKLQLPFKVSMSKIYHDHYGGPFIKVVQVNSIEGQFLV